MSASLLVLLVLADAAPQPDAVSRCREAHAQDPPAHIACLESALGSPPPKAATTTPPPSPPTPTAASIGAEQVEARQRDRDAETESADVMIESVHYDARQHGVFRMADGQLWRETEVSPRHTRLDTGRRYTARIERTRFGGGYRMYVDGSRRMIKVERLE